MEVMFTLEMVVLLGVIVLALSLFLRETFRVDVTAILIMAVLIILGQFFKDEAGVSTFLTPAEGVSGFSNPATIIVLGMFIISAGIQKTGLIYILGKKFARLAGKSQILQITLLSFMVGPLSGFVNNTAMVAITIPMVLRVSQAVKTAATKLLIPLSFFAMLGGTFTLIGTSTNILANQIALQDEYMVEQGFSGFAFFEFAKVGGAFLLVGLIYFLLIGRFLLPNRQNKDSADGDAEKILDYLCEFQLQKDSQLLDKTLHDINFSNRYEAYVIAIARGTKIHDKYISKMKLQEGDILIMSADKSRILDISKLPGMKVLANFDETSRKSSLARSTLVKLMFIHETRLSKKKIRKVDFRKEYNAVIWGIEKKEAIRPTRLKNLNLEVGDAILAEVSPGNLEKIKQSPDFLFFEEVSEQFRWDKGGLALLILSAVIALAAFDILPLMVAVLGGVVAMLLGGFFSKDDVYDSVSWDVIFLLAGLIPLSIAMTNTGLADQLAQLLVGNAGELHPLVLLGVIYIVTTILTEVISNNAAVLLLVPVAISSAATLGLNPVAFVLAVTFAASTSFLSPIGYQTNTMVYGAGNYKFSDFWKVGLPLNLILLFVSVYLIDLFWGVM